jgi:GTP-binding protein
VGFSHLPKQPKGGPDGGDGGKGGDVFLESSENYHSLEHLHKETFLKAEDGEVGGKNKRHGKNGKDLIVYVPIGTAVYKTDETEPLADLLLDGEKIKVAEGGRGGKGNINFATPTNQAPRIATPGKEGEIKVLNLIFSPKADIAVIGPPNSGKSSLIACITGNSPKVAGYPFTTKRPRLWTYTQDFSRYIFMDTPPLAPEIIEDIKILLKRAQTLLIVIDSSRIEEFNKIEPLIKEIEEYLEKNPSKKIAYVLAKTDKVGILPNLSITYPIFPVSIEKEDGIYELKEFLFGKN